MGFDHLLTEFVWVSEPTGVDDYGQRTYGSFVKMAAAIERGSNKVYDLDGNEVSSSISFAHNTPISVNARVVFSASDTSSPDKYRTPVAISSVPSRINSTVYYETFI